MKTYLGNSGPAPTVICPIWVTGLLLISSAGFGAPYFGMFMEMEQPDGKSVPVKIWGDEFYIEATSLEGKPLVVNQNTGYIEYAAFDPVSKTLKPTGDIYHSRINFPDVYNNFQISPPNYPGLNKQKIIDSRKKEHLKNFDFEPRLPYVLKKGDNNTRHIYGMILLIDFPDVPGNVSPEQINQWANMPGYRTYGNNGSIRDYFYDISGGKVEYHNIITPYYTAKNPKSHYDRDDGYNGSYELVSEALAGMEKMGMDFSQLTADANGRVIALNIVFAGAPGRSWGGGIWPHRGAIPKIFYADGVSLRGYNLSHMGQALSLFTICHENGHMLFGWPDLYDYGGESKGTGNYCLMSGSLDAHNPLPPNAYLRIQAGWQIAPNLNLEGAQNYFELRSNSSEVFSYLNPYKGGEMYIVESIIKTGRYASAPDEGLLIWHVDLAGSNSLEQMTSHSHYQVSLEQADGAFDLEKNANAGGAGDLFHKSGKNEFSAASNPNSNWWDGKSSGFHITNIGYPGPKMNFTIGKADPPPLKSQPQTNLVSGLREKYFEGSWNSFPDFAGIFPLDSGITPAPDITSRRRNFNFGYIFEGYIYIANTGTYRFDLETNDEARLLLDDITQIKTSLITGTERRVAGLSLEAGYHKFSLQYISRRGYPFLELSSAFDAEGFSPLPEEAFFVRIPEHDFLPPQQTQNSFVKWEPFSQKVLLQNPDIGKTARFAAFDLSGKKLGLWNKLVPETGEILLPELSEIQEAPRSLIYLWVKMQKNEAILKISP